MEKTGGGEGSSFTLHMHGQTWWHRGPLTKVEFCCAEPGDPGLVIEQYAVLCAPRVRLLMLCSCFISPFTKEEAPANSHLHTSLLAALPYELKCLSIHMWKYTTHTHNHIEKKNYLIVSVQPFLLTVKRKNKKHMLQHTEIFMWKRRKHRLLFSYWPWNVYRFFLKADWGVKHSTIGRKNSSSLEPLWKCQIWITALRMPDGPFLCCLESPLDWNRPGGQRGVKCFGWLYNATR